MFDLFHRALGLSRRGARGELRELERIAQEVNRLSERFEAMSDEELRGMISYFRERYERGETLDELLPEAFAAVREASSRALGMRHFDEQVMGGVALHRGKVAEMRGGEGKTLLVAPLAAYLGAIAGRGVHVVTVSDYLARRDSERAGRVYGFLGMSVGCLQSGVRLDLKKPAYAADVTYGSYSEFSLDYLRDNMVMRAGERVQRGHAFAIVDGVDSILIDEARTPLVIPGTDATVARDDGAWTDGEPTSRAGGDVGDKGQVLATTALQNYFRLYDKLSGVTGAATGAEDELKETYGMPVQAIPTHEPVMRMDHPDLVYQGVDAKLAAVADDIVERHRRGQPVLVGTASIESSERLSRTLGRRGVPHEVLNAKHHEREAQIVAQAGREGAVTIATSMAGRGTDIILGGNPDELARDTMRDKGYLRLDGEWVRRPGEAEWEEARRAARKVCEAERERVLKAGGLCVIGTERHESRRIDDQLRGRSGRRGDPGETQFYLSLEDDLMRLFGGERMDGIAAMMGHYDMPADTPIQSRPVSRAVEGAQREVEEINFAMRKQVLDYDDVMDGPRRAIYEERDKILDGKDLVGYINDVTHDVVRRKVEKLCPEGWGHRDWDLVGLRRWVEDLTGRDDLPRLGDGLGQADVIDQVDHFVDICYSKKSDLLPDGMMRTLSAHVMLRTIDTRWMGFLQEMDYLRAGIGLRRFGGTPPLAAYMDEACAAFAELESDIHEDFLRTILRIELAPVGQARVLESEGDNALRGARYSGPAEVDGDQEGGGASARLTPRGTGAVRAQAPDPAPSKPVAYRKADGPDPYMNVGRNDPCPCGSGKKFKNCHGRNRGGGTR